MSLLQRIGHWSTMHIKASGISGASIRDGRKMSIGEAMIANGEEAHAPVCAPQFRGYPPHGSGIGVV